MSFWYGGRSNYSDANFVYTSNPKYKIDLTGTKQCDVEMDNAIADAGTTKTLVIDPGIYKRSTKTILNCNTDSSPDATINYIGSTVAVQVGTDTSGVFFQRKKFKLPQISCGTKPTTGWVAGTVGLDVINAYRSFVDFVRITGFETGYQLRGKGFGVSYVTTKMGHLDNNMRNQVLDKDTTGWCNQCTFLGGSFSHNSGEGLNVAGTRHIVLNHSAGNADPNNNLWLNPGLESPGVVEYTLDINGAYNMWLNPRFEFTGSHSKVLWGAFAFRNWLYGGFDIDGIIETNTAGSFGNSYFGTTSSKWNVSLATGFRMENEGSSNNAILTLMRAGATTNNDDPATNYTGRFQSSAWRGKRFNDSFDRVNVDVVNGALTFGSGAVAGDANLYRKAADQLATDDSLWLGNQGAAPGTPTGGGLLYVEAGSLKYKGSSGTITVLGAP